MQSFGEMLKQYITEAGYSSYQFAQMIDIDRSTLSNIMSSKKHMTLQKMEFIKNNDIFSEEKLARLSRAWVVDCRGEEKLTRFDLIESFFNSRIKKELSAPFRKRYAEISSDTLSCDSKSKLLAVLNTILKDKDIDTLITNFEFSHYEINRAVYRRCREKRIKDFFHFVAPYGSSEYRNLQILLYSIIYAQASYLTHTVQNSDFGFFFPYFIMTDKYILCYDASLEHGFLFSENMYTEHESFIRSKISDIKNFAQTDTYLSDDALEMIGITERLTLHKAPSSYAIDASVCPMFLSEKTTDEIATEQIKALYPQIAKRMSEHFSDNFNIRSPETIIITYESLERFVKTGRMESYPIEFANSMTEKARAQTLENMLATPIRLCITNPRAFNAEEAYFTLDLISSQIIYLGNNDDPIDSSTVCRVLQASNCQSALSDFEDYMSYLYISEKTFTPDNSKKFLNQHINYLKSFYENKN